MGVVVGWRAHVVDDRRRRSVIGGASDQPFFDCPGGTLQFDFELAKTIVVEFATKSGYVRDAYDPAVRPDRGGESDDANDSFFAGNADTANPDPFQFSCESLGGGVGLRRECLQRPGEHLLPELQIVGGEEFANGSSVPVERESKRDVYLDSPATTESSGVCDVIARLHRQIDVEADPSYEFFQLGRCSVHDVESLLNAQREPEGCRADVVTAAGRGRYPAFDHGLHEVVRTTHGQRQRVADFGYGLGAIGRKSAHNVKSSLEPVTLQVRCSPL